MHHSLRTLGLLTCSIWSTQVLAQIPDATLVGAGRQSSSAVAASGPVRAARPTAAWSTMAPMSTTRAEPGAVAHPNGKIYAWGGYQLNLSIQLASAEAYDIASNTWSAIAPLPTALRGPAVGVGTDGDLYSFGGYTSDYTGISFKYNITANTWTAIAPMPVPRWEARALTAADGRIFVFGGWNNNLTPKVGAEVQIYSPTTNTWATGAAMPMALFGSGAATDAAGLMHVYGGIATSLNPSQEHIVYNVGTNTWAMAASTPVPARAYTSGATGSDGNLYLLGGDNDIPINAGTFYSQVDLYNPTTAAWSSGTALPVALTEAASVASGNAVYVLGGFTASNAPQSTVYRILTGPATSTSWTGAVSNDWFAAGNWTAGVPTTALDALIPAGASPYPLISAGSAVAKKLTLASGGSLTQSGGTLSLSGDFSNGGTFAATGGTVALTGSSSQSLGGTSNISFWNLTVGPNGATLSSAVDMQRLLTLNGGLTTGGNAFTLLSTSARTAMVVNNGGAVVTGSATMQRYLDPSLNSGLGYRHYSSPVLAASVAELATSGFAPVVNPAYNMQGGTAMPFPTVFGYDEARLNATNATTQSFDQGWFSPAAATTSLNGGRGYAVNINASEKVGLTGTLNNGTVPVGALSRGLEANAGWQLLGNPYPAPLDWNVARTGLPTGLMDAIYVFKSAGQYLLGSYQFYQNGFGTLPGGLIGSMQGFFLRVSQNVPAFSFQNSWRSTSFQSPTVNRGTADLRPSVQLDLVDAAGTHEATFVYFENGATAGFDAHYDADKLPNSTGLNLSSEISGGQRLAVNGLPVLGTAPLTVPLTVGVPAAGTYTLNAAQLLNLSTTPVYLRDRQTGTTVSLGSQPSYSFTTAAGTLLVGRFELVFSAQGPLAAASVALAGQVGLYPNPAKSAAFVELPASLGRTVITAMLVDALGRPVRTQFLPAQGAAAHQLSLAGLGSGVYTLQLHTSAGVVVKKLVVE